MGVTSTEEGVVDAKPTGFGLEGGVKTEVDSSVAAPAPPVFGGATCIELRITNDVAVVTMLFVTQ